MTSEYMGPGDFGGTRSETSSRASSAAAPSAGAAGDARPPPFDFLRLMSEPARHLVSDAASYAAEHGSSDLDTEHLLRAALTAEPTRTMVTRAGRRPRRARRRDRPRGGGGPPRRLDLRQPRRQAGAAGRPRHRPRARGASYIGSEHVLVALAANRDSTAGQILDAAHFDPRSAPPAAPADRRPGGRARARAGPRRRYAARRPAAGRSSTPTLDKYGRDLTELAREGRIDPVIGRDEEIEQTIEVLARRGKNNPVLIGEAGVGKTAIVEGLAQRIVDGDVPDNLLGRRVVQLDSRGVVAGHPLPRRLRGAAQRASSTRSAPTPTS